MPTNALPNNYTFCIFCSTREICPVVKPGVVGIEVFGSEVASASHP